MCLIQYIQTFSEDLSEWISYISSSQASASKKSHDPDIFYYCYYHTQRKLNILSRNRICQSILQYFFGTIIHRSVEVKTLNKRHVASQHKACMYITVFFPTSAEQVDSHYSIMQKEKVKPQNNTFCNVRNYEKEVVKIMFLLNKKWAAQLYINK